MKRVIYSILIVVTCIPLALGADIDVNIGNNNNIEFNNVQFENNHVGNCSVFYTEKQPYTRYLYCRICEEGQNPEYYGVWKEVKLTTEQWVSFDKIFYNKYGKYSPWHNNPSPIVQDASETKKQKQKIVAEKARKPYYVSGMGMYNPKTGVYTMNMTEGMTATEKSNYAKAKDFEDNYKNYLEYKSGY